MEKGRIQFEVFKILYDSSKYYHERYLNAVWKTSGLLIIALGWILTSEAARAYISLDNNIRRYATITVVILAFAHLVVLISIQYGSRKIIHKLRTDCFVNNYCLSSDYYEKYRIPSYYPWCSGLLNIILFSALIAFINLN